MVGELLFDYIMSKFYKEIKEYGKASGTFEYAAKRYSQDKQNPALRQEVDVAYHFLMDEAFPVIEKIYKDNPGDEAAISVYEIACMDRMQMQNKFNNL